MSLHTWLRRSASLLTPDERDLGPGSGMSVVDNAEREYGALVVDVPCVSGQPDRLAVPRDAVVRQRRVVRKRQIDVLRDVAVAEQRAEDARDIIAIPHQRDLLARRVHGHLLERLATNELVVELHERAVTEIVGRQVIIPDVFGIEAATE